MRVYPLSSLEIQEWSIEFARLRPKATTEQFQEIIDKFLTGEWFWDKELGFTNLIKGYDFLINPNPYFQAP